MIDLKKYGLLYRLHCLKGRLVIEGDDLESLHTYVLEGLVAGSFAPYRPGERTLELLPDGHLLVQLIKRQIKSSSARLIPHRVISPTYEQSTLILEQE